MTGALWLALMWLAAIVALKLSAAAWIAFAVFSLGLLGAVRRAFGVVPEAP